MKWYKIKKIKSIAVLIVIEGIILLLFLISALGNYFVAKQNSNKRSLQIVQDGYESLIGGLCDDLKNIAKVGYTLLNNEPITRLKAYYYDIVTQDYYARTSAINGVTEQMLSIVSYYDILDSAAVWIAPLNEELYYNTMYTFVGDENKKALLDNAISSHEFSAEYTGTLKNLNGNILLSISLSKVDNCIAAFILDTEYLIKSLKLSAIPLADLYMVEVQNQLCVVCTTEENIHFESNLIQVNETPELHGEKIIYCTKIANVLPLYVEIDTNKIDGLNLYMLFFVCAFVLLLLASFISVIVFNTYFNRPIRIMLKAMEQVGKGDFSMIINEKIGTDFQNLYDGFNSMVGAINGYVEENYRQQVMRTESEFKALQAQINPHFLYNCFANIRNLCKMGDLESVELMTGKLSKLFLYVTRTSESIVSLQEEFENMLDYVSVQQVRFGDRVKVECKPLTAEYYNLKIPKLCLQPIVENAYKYVFSNIESGGVLKIDYRQVEDVFEIVIEDNGAIDNDMLESIKHNICETSGVVTGLINVSRRLNRYAGDKQRFKLERSELGGLSVTIILDCLGETDV